MTYVLMDPDRGYVIGVGPSDKQCPECGHAGTARGGFEIKDLLDPDSDWEADEYDDPWFAQLFLNDHPGLFETYRPVPLATLHRKLEEFQP